MNACVLWSACRHSTPSGSSDLKIGWSVRFKCMHVVHLMNCATTCELSSGIDEPTNSSSSPVFDMLVRAFYKSGNCKIKFCGGGPLAMLTAGPGFCRASRTESSVLEVRQSLSTCDISLVQPTGLASCALADTR